MTLEYDVSDESRARRLYYHAQPFVEIRGVILPLCEMAVNARSWLK